MAKYHEPGSSLGKPIQPRPAQYAAPVQQSGYSGDGFWSGYLKGGYFDDKGGLRKEFVDREHMEPLAWAMADGKLSVSQIRRFFSHCRAIEGKLRAGGSPWALEATNFTRLDVFAADALSKGKVPKNFHDFIKTNIAAVHTADDFLRGFMPHFEALVGFGNAHFANPKGTNVKKTDYHEITGVIELGSGMRIGGSDDLLQIGGADLTCIRNPVSHAPYIPVSLKGKMRSELESKEGSFGGQNGNEPCGCANCIVCAVFGMHKPKAHNLGPSRIIVRDAQLLSGGETENKSSTAIDRATGTALRGALRTEQRVVAGSTFKLRIGVQIWEMDAKAEYSNLKKVKAIGPMALVAFVLDGLKLVERTGLGSGVSKGSGEIRLVDLKLDGKPVPDGMW